MHTDLVNVSRGRAIVGYDPAERPPPTVGWVPADLGLNAFGGLSETPWGPVGDLRLAPDPATFTEVDADPSHRPPFRFVLARCTEAGADWPSCPRVILSRAVDLLRSEFGLRLRVGFEHEFSVASPEVALPFSVDAGRRAEPLLSNITAALHAGGLRPEHILPEFGHNQFEVTIEPGIGLAGADRAVMTREIIREVARADDQELSFAPVTKPRVAANGAHIHLSLIDEDDEPIMEAADRPLGLSDRARSFAAGILNHLPALTAITAPSVVSYLRLKPRSWSTGYRAIGISNRETAIRISPGRPAGGGRGHLGPSLELRASDATANPYLALAAVITAGADGLRRQLEIDRTVDGDPADLSPEERAARGIDDLPSSLDRALDELEANKELRAIFGPELDRCWFTLKRSEAEMFRSATPTEIIEAYSRVY